MSALLISLSCFVHKTVDLLQLSLKNKSFLCLKDKGRAQGLKIYYLRLANNGDRKVDLTVETLGTGEPSHAVVACVHGDELCGYRAVQKLKKSDFNFSGSVKLIIANNLARKRKERSVEKDLNRCFPGNPESDVYEKRLAARLLEEIEGLTVLDLHSTVSRPTPFAFYIGEKNDLVRKAGMERAVDLSYLPETMMNYMHGISVECGVKGTEQAFKNAFDIMVNFLAAEGVIEEKYSLGEPELFEIFDEAMGSKYSFEAENFQKVEKGEVYAVNGSKKKKAEQDFIPILMSDNGYSHKIGYKGRRISG